MRITKFGHACVRIESDGQVLVIDPGSFTDREAVDGATGVLITHEHADHFDADNLGATGAPIFTIAAVAEQMSPDLRDRTTIVVPGQQFDTGLAVRAVGEWHAVIHEELPRFHNCGYVVSADDAAIYHPGDSFTLPGQEIDVLLIPVSGPWNKVAEVIDFARAVGAPKNLAIHELVASEIGLNMTDARMSAMLRDRGLAYQRVQPGQDITLG